MLTNTSIQVLCIAEITKNEMLEIMVAPYLAGMVDHATMDETAKITDYINLACGLTWITDSVLIWDVNDDGQRGEAEDEDSLTSDTSILCTRDRDLLIPIKANQPMTKY